jgi:hypothetical protein
MATSNFIATLSALYADGVSTSRILRVTESSPPPAEQRRLLQKMRGQLSLSRVQTIFGLIAALLSIGGALYGYLRPRPAPNVGEVFAIVQEAKSSKPVADATVELLTAKDALVTTLNATGGQARQTLKEGPYRVRVSHPRYGTEVRQIQVIAGQTAEVRFRLAQRPTASSPLAPAGRVVDEGVESIKKIFR